VRKTRKARLHGSVPDVAPVVLLIVDMLSDFSSPELRPWRAGAIRAAQRIASLKKRAQIAHIPTIYVNDNTGRWRSDAENLVQCAEKSKTGRFIVESAGPSDEDYLILKPKHSIFYATPLDTLLEHIGAHALIITGATSTQCILFSAIDAHVRDYRLYIPRDCVVSSNRKDANVSEYLFKKWMGADTRPSEKLRLTSLRKRHGSAKV
jgi:nicotinamidase-related amidase